MAGSDGRLTRHSLNRAGKAFDAFRKDFKHAQEEVKDQITVAAALWSRIEPQLLVLRRTASLLGERFLNLQDEMLARLQTKLKDLVARSEKLLTTPSFRRYVIDRLSQVETRQDRGKGVEDD